MSGLKLGQQGERWASDYLAEKDFIIKEKNYHCRGGEIDIIAEKNGRLHFIEVKTRRPQELCFSEELIPAKKRNCLNVCINNYLFKKGVTHDNYQLDLLLVLVDTRGNLKQIDLFEGI